MFPLEAKSIKRDMLDVPRVNLFTKRHTERERCVCVGGGGTGDYLFICLSMCVYV